MALTIEATYENGVFVPIQPVDLLNHERVRLTVERPTQPSALEIVRRRRDHRIQIDPQLAQEIARSPEFNIEES